MPTQLSVANVSKLIDSIKRISTRHDVTADCIFSRGVTISIFYRNRSKLRHGLEHRSQREDRRSPPQGGVQSYAVRTLTAQSYAHDAAHCSRRR